MFFGNSRNEERELLSVANTLMITDDSFFLSSTVRNPQYLPDTQIIAA